jgi:hypothetical protein
MSLRSGWRPALGERDVARCQVRLVFTLPIIREWTLPADHPSAGAMLSWAHHQDRDYCPSIHMPRWASRITLEVTKVRVERLQDISEDDAGDEGAPRETIHAMNNTARMWYRSLWNSLHGVEKWDENPWVWVIEFRKVKTDASHLNK